MLSSRAPSSGAAEPPSPDDGVPGPDDPSQGDDRPGPDDRLGTPDGVVRRAGDDWRLLADRARQRLASPVVWLAVVAVVVLLVAWSWWTWPAAVDVETVLPSVGEPGAVAPPSTTTPTQRSVVVHAAGAVARPGLVVLDEIDPRVADVVAAAGGLTAEADPDRLNLAAPVVDGERVYVPRLGEDVPLVPGDPAVGEQAGPVDVNRATAAELDELPGVGPATAAAIIEVRDDRGRFGSVDELLDVPGIGPAKLDQLRPLVVVGP